jgi:hypothetical protein
VPAAGLVELAQFYGSLADGVFHSTQYVRHHSVPLYTPEPDVLHEVFGHGNCLAHDRFAALYRAAGDAVRRVETEDALEFISKVFWFSLEFGVVREGGEVRTYGAGLLSSYGEIQQIAQADLRPLDIARMGVQTYDITHYQPILFCGDGFGEVEDVVGSFFTDVDDDLVSRLMHDRLGAPCTRAARLRALQRMTAPRRSASRALARRTRPRRHATSSPSSRKVRCSPPEVERLGAVPGQLEQAAALVGSGPEMVPEPNRSPVRSEAPFTVRWASIWAGV